MDNQTTNQLIVTYDPLELMTANEAARLLKVHFSTVYLLMGNGAIPTVKFGRSVRIRRVDLEDFIKAHLEWQRS